MFGSSIAIPLVLSLATLVHYAARSKQSSTNSCTAEAGPEKLAAPVLTRLTTTTLACVSRNLRPNAATHDYAYPRSLRRSLQWMRRAGVRQLRGAYTLRSTPDFVTDRRYVTPSTRPAHHRGAPPAAFDNAASKPAFIRYLITSRLLLPLGLISPARV